MQLNRSIKDSNPLNVRRQIKSNQINPYPVVEKPMIRYQNNNNMKKKIQLNGFEIYLYQNKFRLNNNYTFKKYTEQIAQVNNCV